ncbi:MAG: putative peptide transporter, permease protein, partial [Deltaproteobacteria bacterium]|nr:putative peptide transporter, permease protein [Deltaproteobacteria bacterium]
MAFFTLVLRRTVYGLILVFAVILLNFILIHIAPGDPAEMLAGEMGGATQEIMASIRTAYGLDKSIPEQFLIYLGRMSRGDMGTSFYYNQPVTQLILQRIPATLSLSITALLMAIILGIILGTIASQNPQGWFSGLVTVGSIAGFAAPVFWVGIMLLILFAYLLPLFPSFGIRTVALTGGSIIQALDFLHHLVLPAFTLAIVFLAQYSRLMRASMLDVLGSDFVRMLRAKGLSERVVVYKHGMKNAILPVITIAGLQFSMVFGGAIIVETVFNW